MNLYWIWLTHIPGVGPAAQRQLLTHFGSPQAVFAADCAALKKVPGIANTQAETIYNHRCLDKAKRCLDNLQAADMTVLTVQDRQFPVAAREHRRLPVVFYIWGTIPVHERAIAVFGTRQASAYGLRLAAEAAQALADYSLQLVSVLSEGINRQALATYLQANQAPLAIAPGGRGAGGRFDEQTIRRVAETGAVVYLHPPGMPWQKQHVRQCSALLSAWATAGLLIEAPAKSGALATARAFMENDRPLLAAPHHLDARRGQGNNILLQSGARIYLGSKQLSQYADGGCSATARTQNPQEAPMADDSIQQQILSLASQGPCLLDEVLAVLGKTHDHNAILGAVSALEIQGKVELKSSWLQLPAGRVQP